jgi:hypothetical protein
MATTQRSGTDFGTMTALHSALAQVTRRLRLARWLGSASRGALIAVALSLLAVGLDHWHLLPKVLPLALVIPVLLLLGVGIGSLAALAHPVDAMAAARLTENRLGLKERLSSALEFERTGQTPRDPEAALLFRMQQEDAAACARGLQVADAVPLRLPWESKALIPAVILLLLALILPALPIFIPPAVRNERAIVQKSGEKLQRDARVIEKRADAQGLPQTKKAAQDLQKLGQKMAQGSMDKKQAMVQASQLSKQMADEQRRQAEANSQAGQGGKDLTQAGQQLAQALSQSAGVQHPSPHGLTPPDQKSGTSGSKAGHTSSSTPEMQKAGQAMQQNNTPGLSEQLRALAQRTATGRMTPAERQQAAQDLQKLSDALKGTPLTETQQHAQAATDALKRGDTQQAADEMRRAADAADRQAQQQADAQGMQNDQQSLQRGQQQMAQASKPGDIHDETAGASSQSQGSGQQGRQGGSGQHGPELSPGPGQQPGQGGGKFNNVSQSGQSGSGNQQGGAPTNGGNGNGKGSPNKPGPGHYTPASGVGQKTPSQNVGVWRGAAHPLDPKFDPKKNPNYGKVFLGAGDGSGGGKTIGKSTTTKPGTPPAPGQSPSSSVPYYNTLAPARKSAETAMDKEDIPPSYRTSVRRYFDALQPANAKPAK